MTSFIINSQVERASKPQWSLSGSDCVFCRIKRNEIPAYKLYENDKVFAILDIMPLRKGHALVIPKEHYSRVSELPPEIAAAVGEAVSKVAGALVQATEHTALNIVCNQEYAQAVPHVHYHIIPAPILNASSSQSTQVQPTASSTSISPPPSRRRMHQMEFESRSELDDEDADMLVTKIKARL
ncbi:HIT-like protein [Pluteus cervinus]|uniref:HIT-like protein n=1 Tax=Pluteus cervinus TaxID=181527 RepID=A0ACD3AZI2_9AGAR|nr:HIT-like protein [Pluteus cervinus]